MMMIRSMVEFVTFPLCERVGSNEGEGALYLRLQTLPLGAGQGSAICREEERQLPKKSRRLMS